MPSRKIYLHKTQALQELVDKFTLSKLFESSTRQRKEFGIHVRLWEHIASAQLFAQQILHPFDRSEKLEAESKLFF